MSGAAVLNELSQTAGGPQMITTEKGQDHLLVYWNGKLIYKVWRKTGQSVILDAHGLPWAPADRDRREKR